MKERKNERKERRNGKNAEGPTRVSGFEAFGSLWRGGVQVVRTHRARIVSADGGGLRPPPTPPAFSRLPPILSVQSFQRHDASMCLQSPF